MTTTTITTDAAPTTRADLPVLLPSQAADRRLVTATLISRRFGLGRKEIGQARRSPDFPPQVALLGVPGRPVLFDGDAVEEFFRRGPGRALLPARSTPPVRIGTRPTGRSRTCVWRELEQ